MNGGVGRRGRICTGGMFECLACQDLVHSNLLVGRLPQAGKLTRNRHSYAGFPSSSLCAPVKANLHAEPSL